MASYKTQFNMIHLINNHRYPKRTKHINVRYYRIRHWVIVKKIIDLVKISTKENPADMMIKTNPMEKFRDSLNFINVLQR